MIVLPHTKFRITHTINRWQIAINEFQYGDRPPFWICKGWYFDRWPLLERESASANPISLETDDFQLRYGDKTIFKLASVRHLEFTKFGILVTWPVSEHYSTSSYQILHQSDNKSLSYSQKTIFNMAAVRHFKLAKFWYLVMWPFLERESASAYQISLKMDDSRLRYSD